MYYFDDRETDEELLISIVTIVRRKNCKFVSELIAIMQTDSVQNRNFEARSCCAFFQVKYE